MFPERYSKSHVAPCRSSTTRAKNVMPEIKCYDSRSRIQLTSGALPQSASPSLAMVSIIDIRASPVAYSLPRWRCQLRLFLDVVIILVACATPKPVAAPVPYTIAVGPFEPTLDISRFSTIICCSNCMEIKVDRVIDGDTFQRANARIRLFGIDTPERGEPCSNEATQRIKEMTGDSVRVEFGPRQEDWYGRILYYVYNERGESIDEMLVKEGFAEAWTRDGKHRDVLVAAEKGARRDGFGCLWPSSK